MPHLPFKTAAIAATPAGSIEARIVQNCAADLARGEADVVLVARQSSTIDWFRKALTAIAGSDVVIFHSPFIFSVFLVMVAKLLGKRIVSLVWDIYPVRLNGRRYDRRLIRRAVDMLERLCVAAADLVLVPSPDFQNDPSLAGAEFEPLWVETKRTGRPQTKNHRRTASDDVEVLQILFAGQINATRGLDHALATLEEVMPAPFLLKIATFSELPENLQTDRRIEFLGGLNPAELEAAAAECDFGLVALSPALDGAGFPSKTFDYLAFGLPVIYCGPSLDYFNHLLQKTGVGVDISKTNRISLDRLLHLKADFSRGRTAFLEETTLRPRAMAEKLSRFGNRP